MAHSRRLGRSTTGRLLILVIVTASLAAACGSGSSAVLSPVGNSVGGEPVGAPAEPDNQQPAASGGLSGGGSGGSGGEQGGTNGAAFRDLAKIVYTGSLSLKVTDLDAAVKAGRDAVLAEGGYIGGTHRTTDGDRSVATITYRIPADRWEDVLETLRRLGEVLGEEIEATEVTGQLVDLQARIRNLRVSEAAIQEIAKKAVTFEEILDGQARLSDVRGQIEQLDAQRASLEERADLGTLSVTYGKEIVAVVAAAEEAKWDAGGEVARATDTLVSFLQGLTTAGIWLGIVWLPALLLLLVVALAARMVLRRVGLLGRLEQELGRPTVPPTGA